MLWERSSSRGAPGYRQGHSECCPLLPFFLHHLFLQCPGLLWSCPALLLDGELIAVNVQEQERLVPPQLGNEFLVQREDKEMTIHMEVLGICILVLSLPGTSQICPVGDRFLTLEAFIIIRKHQWPRQKWPRKHRLWILSPLS